MDKRKITTERVLAAVADTMFGLGRPGFCLSCGADADDCDPDSRNIECGVCHRLRVFGAEEVLMRITS
jgi:hypothetical protein